MTSKSAGYTKPELRERIKSRVMASGDGGKPGQWSARKAQLVAQKYESAGGGYSGAKTEGQKSLSKWTNQNWTTSDGKPAERKGGTTRYLPEKAWKKLSPSERAATNAKKRKGSRKGEQFVANTEAAAAARKKESFFMDKYADIRELAKKEVFQFYGLGQIIEKIAARRGVKELRTLLGKAPPPSTKEVARRVARGQGTREDITAASNAIREFETDPQIRNPLGRVMTRHPNAQELIEQKFGPGGMQKILTGRDFAEVGRSFGAGMEGVAYPALTPHAPTGMGVVKVIDPTAPLTSMDTIAGRRAFIGAKNPHLSTIYAEAKPRQVGGMQAPVFVNEYVPGRDLNTDNVADRMAAHNLENAVRNYQVAGHSPIDVNPHNMKMTPGGVAKAFDFTAAPTHALKPGGPRSGHLAQAFTQGMNDPFIAKLPELNPNMHPVTLRERAAHSGTSYGDYMLRGDKTNRK